MEIQKKPPDNKITETMCIVINNVSPHGLFGILMKRIPIVIAFLLFAAPASAVIYLDGNLASNCTGNYSIANRACNGSDGNAYNTLAGAMAALTGGNTLFIRSGTYGRDNGQSSGGGAAWYNGAINVTVSGSSESVRTVISGYGNEQPVIHTGNNGVNSCGGVSGGTQSCLQYPPDPSDTGNNGTRFYPKTAVYISGNYVTVKNIKTYGSVAIGDSGGNYATLDSCDFGGGGPVNWQGGVISLPTNPGRRQTIIKNNKIHHSVAAPDGTYNGTAIMAYSFEGEITNNEFYDNWSGDVMIKDSAGHSGHHAIVAYNFIRPKLSSSPVEDVGYRGHNQAQELDYILIHHNIFFGKTRGFDPYQDGSVENIVYNNTFINCTSDTYTEGATDIAPHRLFNNLFYHTNSSSRYVLKNYSGSFPSRFIMDGNMYYTTSGTTWYSAGTTYSTPATWSAYIAANTYHEQRSISGTNPNLVNPSGTTVADFKRSSYPNDVTAGSYVGTHITVNLSTHTGAYETGSEIIGTGTGVARRPSAPIILTP